ncbi:hypothetical protein CSCA_0997 [Clostridium scatologenes]|uniref:Uncharacterized protein n=1 Tax=Clostridium scatologenes TaxID=1548 RepID=A0A0E3M8B5_CLOSL|nr:hypothetical protein CSCA_0997 [Clostridium scatologenes]
MKNEKNYSMLFVTISSERKSFKESFQKSGVIVKNQYSKGDKL